jgi:hypothetical protein
MMNIDYEAQQRAQAQLEPGERLLWWGKPDPKRGLLLTIPIALFGIPWTAFSIFWMSAASGLVFGNSQRSWFSLFALFGLPFVLVGLGMLTAPYWAYLKAQQTIYALTSRRALIIIGGRATKVQSYTGSDIGTIERTDRANGKSDVLFATVTTSKSTQSIGFMGIENGRHIERLLLDTFKTKNESRTTDDAPTDEWGITPPRRSHRDQNW